MRRVLRLSVILLSWGGALRADHCTVEPPQAMLRTDAVRPAAQAIVWLPPAARLPPVAVERATLVPDAPAVVNPLRNDCWPPVRRPQDAGLRAIRRGATRARGRKGPLARRR